jgi:hypothetical protein
MSKTPRRAVPDTGGFAGMVAVRVPLPPFWAAGRCESCGHWVRERNIRDDETHGSIVVNNRTRVACGGHVARVMRLRTVIDAKKTKGA